MDVLMCYSFTQSDSDPSKLLNVFGSKISSPILLLCLPVSFPLLDSRVLSIKERPSGSPKGTEGRFKCRSSH